MKRNAIVADPAATRSDPTRLIRGGGSFVADLELPGCLEAAFARSWEAHGRLIRADASRARSADGVVDAVSATDFDIPDTPAPHINPVDPVYRRPSLATDRVRYVGEPIAVVVATDRYLAEDALEEIDIEIEPLAHVLDPLEAGTPEAPELFTGATNVSKEELWGTPLEEMRGIMETAPVVVECSIRNERVSPAPMEGRAIACVPDGEAGITVYCSHQAPHQLRNVLSAIFGLERENVRVVVPDAGGAFGQKSHTFPEYVAVVHAAMRLGRPVRWVEDRRENLMASTHGRGQSQRVRMAADRNGDLLGLEVSIDADIGAYPHTGGAVPLFSALVQSGPYKFPRVSVVCRSIVTNNVPTAPYRGAGRPEATFAIEVTMDRLADELDMDPAELRLRNFVAGDAFPYPTPTGAIYDSGDYAATLRRALDLSGYEDFRDRQRAARDEGRMLGIGICSFVERSGGHDGGTEFAEVVVGSEGKIVVRSGSMATGQNHRGAFASMVAAALKIDPGRIEVVQGDTEIVREGTGSFASRSMQVGGSAAIRAADEVLERAWDAAAELLEVAPEDLAYDGGLFSVTGAPEVSISLERIAATTGELSASHTFASQQAFPYGSYIAEVEVDPGTFGVTILQLTAVDDCGTVIGARSLEGQVTGSIAQGVGQALYEKIVYDEHGQILTVSLADYCVPTAAEIPPLVLAHIQTPNPNAPNGAKGGGESGCIGAPPAIANAVFDALGGRPESVALPLDTDMVWQLYREITER